jgi:hypothetical protein
VWMRMRRKHVETASVLALGAGVSWVVHAK